MTPPQPAVGQRSVVGRVLFLAQLPPPIHGLSVVSQKVHNILKDHGWQIDKRSPVSARSMQDIGKKSVGKFVELGAMLAGLVGSALIGRRYRLSYQTFTPWSHAALRDAFVAWLAGFVAQRVIVHVHTEGMDQLVNGNAWRERTLRRLLRGSEVVTITDEAAELARGGRIFSAIHQLPNAVPDPGEITFAPRDNQDPVRLVYLGNYDKRKGILDFVDVVAKVQERGVPVSAVVMGHPTHFVTERDLHNAIEAAGVAPLVSVIGPVGEEEKTRTFRESDLFVYPTRHDHAPLVLLEAMAHGVVPITLDAGGVRSLIGADLADNVSSHKADRELSLTVMTDRVCSYARSRDTLARDRQLARLNYFNRFRPELFEEGLLRIFTLSDVPVSAQVRGAARDALTSTR